MVKNASLFRLSRITRRRHPPHLGGPLPPLPPPPPPPRVAFRMQTFWLGHAAMRLAILTFLVPYLSTQKRIHRHPHPMFHSHAVDCAIRLAAFRWALY
jgi:hypothetical protein